MKRFGNVFAVVVLLILIASVPSLAQRANEEARLSPNALVSQTVGTTVITVEYGRPGVKGRTVWGELVPLNAVWRAGANEATTIEFSTAVTVNENKIPAGKYSLFIIPKEDTWTVILNSVAKQWGAYKYDKTKDVLRFEITPSEGEHVEWLEYSFSDLSADTAHLNLMWEKARVVIPVKIEQ